MQNTSAKFICLMGPTASGKSSAVMALARHRQDIAIISIDSAQIYRDMDIGTAKPTVQEQHEVPHYLLDICDVTEAYSVARLRQDVEVAIADAVSKSLKPVLVGGTMMYFYALMYGLDDLPSSDPAVRQAIEARAGEEGWAALHAEMKILDPVWAKKVHENDRQRISRAWEIYTISQEIPSVQFQEAKECSEKYHPVLITAPDRALLHQRIEQRFHQMLGQGFVQEVRALYQRGGLQIDMPSMRCVGYRQLWRHVSGEESYDDAVQKAIYATRQLAKRQLTWQSRWPQAKHFAIGDASLSRYLSSRLQEWE